MFTLAWLLLPDLPEYRTGLIIIGLARCIAMVLIWNDLACGDREAAAVLVAINSVFQIAAYAVLGYFYLELLPGWLGLDTSSLDVSMWEIAKIVVVFLGIPLVAGYLTRRWGEAYFVLMWILSFALGLRLRMSYSKNTSMSFTAASNNFELAIAIAIGVFGVTSGEALAGVVGPLIEVPVLVGLVYVALRARRRFYPATPHDYEGVNQVQ